MWQCVILKEDLKDIYGFQIGEWNFQTVWNVRSREINGVVNDGLYEWMNNLGNLNEHNIP